MLIMGYRITERVQKIARDAILHRQGSFSALHIGREIKAHIRESKSAWRGMSVNDAAVAAADALIWEQYRAGLVKPTGTWLGRQYWRVIDQKAKRSQR
ncbi:hypothetical protein [Bordetella sp. 15P40C-2]|uniref:hypothetical protein n=1 Tax=Bordetella sp. 15P40C-2 TaxID=2572246 RepID=UPI0013266F20|nr:hypothetical protein [Bordetella sp. 15P40C-2]MVW72151.1 hypothetical protein [Bordetella sp. 15P40C-2]